MTWLSGLSVQCEEALTEIIRLVDGAIGPAPIQIVLDDTAADNFQALQDQLDAIPNGTAEHPQQAVLPAGVFPITGSVSDTIGNTLRDKQWVNLIGPGSGLCELYWTDYGPVGSDGRHARRHLKIDESFNCTVSGFTIRGPHTDRIGDRAKYTPGYEFQHGVTLDNSDHIHVDDVACVDVAGDGIYLNDSDYLTFTNVTCRYNGRHNLAAISGDDLLFDNWSAFGAGRCVIDLEPIGLRTYSDGVRADRWVRGMTVRNSSLGDSPYGLVVHRATDITVEDSVLNSHVKIEDNVGPQRQNITFRNLERTIEPFAPATQGWPLFYVQATHNLTVSGCRMARKVPLGGSSAFVRIRGDENVGMVTGNIEIIGNDLPGHALSVLLWQQENIDAVMAATTWTVENNNVKPEFPDPPTWLTDWWAAHS